MKRQEEKDTKGDQTGEREWRDTAEEMSAGEGEGECSQQEGALCLLLSPRCFMGALQAKWQDLRAF